MSRPFLLSIHTFTAAFDCAQAALPDLMASVYSLRVPLQVDLKIGQNWQDMERVRVVAAQA